MEHPPSLEQSPSVSPSKADVEAEYYRITYRGVVALLECDDVNAKKSKDKPKKSGAYVGYGEIIKSNHVIMRSTVSSNSSYCSYGGGGGSASHPVSSSMPLSPSQSMEPTSSVYSGGFHSAEHRVKVIRVDEVLTGGYAVDGNSSSSSASVHRPLHVENTQIGGEECNLAHQGHGYLTTQRRGVTLAERVDAPQICESGLFLYRVCSSTPIPILVGPAVDAPKTRAMLMPNTVHEVCLRVLLRHSASDISVLFLRLNQRKGWIYDRILVGHKASSPGSISRKTQFVVQEVTKMNTSASTGNSTISSAGIPRSSSGKQVCSISKSINYKTPRKLRMQGYGIIRDNAQSENERNSSDTTIDTANTPISQLTEIDDTITTDTKFGVASSLLDTSCSSNKHLPVQPNFFLMRVVAPLGLKILPHFQMNSALKKRNANSSGTSGETTQIKSRILPYGTLFEASKQILNSGASAVANSAGLLQLSDNSGWAIIPHQDELQQQFGNVGNLAGNLCAVQEVGNAIISSQSSKIWLRVLPTNGVLISCPPPPNSATKENNVSPVSSTGDSSFFTRFQGKAPESDAVSSIAGESAFSETSRMQRHKKDLRQQMQSLNLQKQPIIIPCGTCLEVEESASIELLNTDSSPGILFQVFARICGGQGWIPRHLDGEDFAKEVNKPEVRLGSFWFRVQDKRGSVVRQGPSRKALPIFSPTNGEEFRFECGEFLRASEILTIGDIKSMESYARLYRKSNVERAKQHDESQKMKGRFSENTYPFLSELTTPGEWVAIHAHGNLYLEQCATVPTIERHRAGWRYNVVQNEAHVRLGPSFLASKSNKILKSGESVLVVERVTAHGDQVTWLRLKDGQGWCHDTEEDGRVIMIANSLKWRSRAELNLAKKGTEAEYTKGLISKLFASDTASSIISL